MPAQYEAMRDMFISKGTPVQEAKSRAAAIYNSTHKSAPVTGKAEPNPQKRAKKQKPKASAKLKQPSPKRMGPVPSSNASSLPVRPPQAPMASGTVSRKQIVAGYSRLPR